VQRVPAVPVEIGLLGSAWPCVPAGLAGSGAGWLAGTGVPSTLAGRRPGV